MKIHCAVIGSALLFTSFTFSAEKRWDPYVYGEKNERARAFFLSILPAVIKDEIQKQVPGSSYLTSCKIDLTGDGNDDLVVSVNAKDAKTAFSMVFSMDGSRIKKKYSIELSPEIKLSGSKDDYIETYCVRGKDVNTDGALTDLKFSKPTAKTPLIQLKTYEMDGFRIFSYDKKKDIFKDIGGIYPH